MMTALRPGEYVPPGRYARLFVNGTMFMSDTPMERNTNYAVVRNAHGNVLIAGLGIGLRLGLRIELALQNRELNAQRLDRFVLHRGLAPTHDLEVLEGHRLDERAADVEAEGQHLAKGTTGSRRLEWA